MKTTRHTLRLAAAAWLLSATTTLLAAAPQEGLRDRENLKVSQLTLKNGLTVWLNEDHSQPKVYGALVVRAGAKDCPDTGIAHYLEHVLFKGTEKIGTVDYAQEKVWLDSIAARYDELSATKDAARRLQLQHDISRLSQRAADYAIPNEFDRLISKYGGSQLNASTSWDRTEYHNTFAPQFLEQWCELNSERMLNPVFRLFQGELETVYEEKNRADDDMGREALNKVMEAAFKGHPYQYPIIGSTENLKNPRLGDMASFFRRYYVAGNMCLILSGDFDAATVAPLLERTFGRLPAGEAPRTAMPALQPFGGETVKVKVNLPLIKVVGLLFRGPLSRDRDYYALQLAMRLLTNENRTGLLDSLRTAHQVMLAAGSNFAFSEAGAVAVVAVPRLPFGRKKTAEQLCWQQIERLKRGDFTDAQLEELKLELQRSVENELETIGSRAEAMTAAYTDGRTWTDYLSQLETVSRLTKADVVSAAQRYLLTDHYLRGVKKFGSYPKDKVSQPDYKPVVPKHAREQSAYARQLAAQPVSPRAPRLVDLDHDVETLPLSSHATLYKAANPVNDLFELSLRWHKGERLEPRLALLESYLGELGTDSLSAQQLRRSWQRLGTTVQTTSDATHFTVTISGFERHLAPSLQLLGHVLRSLKADEKATQEMKKEYKVNRDELTRDNKEVLRMVVARISKGQRSPYLEQPSVAEVRKARGTDLLRLLDDVRQYDCSVLYSGSQPATTVAALCRQHLPLSASSQPAPDSAIPLQEPAEPTVYIYDMPDTRQTYVGIYGSVKPSLTDREEALLRLWSQYMGGGMSSLLFQEIREFRAMAYATGGQALIPNRARHADHPSAFVATLGTQADKTMQALAVLDSLLAHMPVNEQNVEAAKQELLNEVNNLYPTFRQLPASVAAYRAEGYAADPRTAYVGLVPTLTAADMTDFYRRHIQQQPRAVFIIGNKKQLDMKQLSRYGRIVELKEKDIIR